MELTMDAGSAGTPGGQTGAEGAADAGGIWSSLPSVNEIVSKLGGAALTRAAYEINRPVASDARTRSPEGLLGNLGTVRVVGGLDGTTKWILIAAAAAVGIYLLTR